MAQTLYHRLILPADEAAVRPLGRDLARDCRVQRRLRRPTARRSPVAFRCHRLDHLRAAHRLSRLAEHPGSGVT
jgi:hypothetical protein